MRLVTASAEHTPSTWIKSGLSLKTPLLTVGTSGGIGARVALALRGGFVSASAAAPAAGSSCVTDYTS
jgi:hypothetical protein